MGGAALKSITTRRLPAAEYEPVKTEVLTRLRQALPGRRIEAIPAYAEKPDFGDLDVLVESDGIPQDYRSRASHTLHSSEVVPNGNVTSLDFGPAAFQVDLILTPTAEFDVAMAYFSWNDLSNLIGRIAHKMGFKYGHKGLLYPVREGTHLWSEILVSRDIPTMLSFLGYDPARYVQGFVSLEDIFKFAASTPLFNRELFLLENRSHVARTRDRKRKTYCEFLQWLETQPGLPAFEYPAEKQVWVTRAMETFPSFEESYLAAQRGIAQAKQFKQMFPPAEIGRLLDIAGKDLGAVLSRLREWYSPDIAMFCQSLGLEDRLAKAGICPESTKRKTA